VLQAVEGGFMGIGRREFLRLFGAAITSASATPTSALTLLDDLYINRRLGIAFQKPSGWIFANVQQMRDLKAGQILDLEDLFEAQAILDATDVPLLMISKEPLSASPNRFTPGVTVFREYATSDEVGSEEPTPLLQTATFDIENCDTLLRNFKVLTAPARTSVSGCEAIVYESRFLFEHEAMRPTPVRMTSLVIAQQMTYYTLRMYDSPYVGGEQFFDYSSFISQIKIV
jgi:hypothetical protein